MLIVSPRSRPSAWRCGSLVAQQSLFADELSTRYIVAGRGLGDVISIVHTDAEITPPLYFVAGVADDADRRHARAAARAVADRRRARRSRSCTCSGCARSGAAPRSSPPRSTAFSPFMIYYSAEARGYELMVVLVLRLDARRCSRRSSAARTRWWVAYAACACARRLHALHERVRARRPARAGCCGRIPAARRPALARQRRPRRSAFLPWLSGLQGDLDSPTTDILSALQPFTPGYVRDEPHRTGRSATRTPDADPRIRDLPGVPALLLVALGARARAGRAPAAALRGRLRARPRASCWSSCSPLSVPVGEAARERGRLEPARHAQPGGVVAGVRALPRRAPRRRRAAARHRRGRRSPSAAFAVGARRSMLDRDFRRPDYDGVAALRRPRPRRPATSSSTARASARRACRRRSTSRSPAATARFHARARPRSSYDPFRILAARAAARPTSARRGRRRGGRHAPVPRAGATGSAAWPRGRRRARRPATGAVDARSYPRHRHARGRCVSTRTQTASGA